MTGRNYREAKKPQTRSRIERFEQILRVMLHLRRPRPLITFIILFLTASVARGQNERTTTQFWADYDPTWRLSEQWNLDIGIGTRVSNSDRFLLQLRLQPTLEYSPLKWMDLTGGVWLIYAKESVTFDRFEARPVGGIRLKVDIWRGVRLSDYLRGEYRVQRNLNTGDTRTARRLRNRIQAMIPINHRSLSENNTWFAIVDTEWFWQLNQNVNDGFNGRRRDRAGIGWRKDSTWSFRWLYIRERTRVSANLPFSTADHIFSFSVIQRLKC